MTDNIGDSIRDYLESDRTHDAAEAISGLTGMSYDEAVKTVQAIVVVHRFGVVPIDIFHTWMKDNPPARSGKAH